MNNHSESAGEHTNEAVPQTERRGENAKRDRKIQKESDEHARRRRDSVAAEKTGGGRDAASLPPQVATAGTLAPAVRHSTSVELQTLEVRLLKLHRMQQREQQLEALCCALRQRGWRVRDGVQYGVDLLLYRSCGIKTTGQGIDLHQRHAPFLLLLLDPSVTWRSVSGASRLASSVGKDLLLAAPLLPPAATPSASAATSNAGLKEASATESALVGEARLAFRILRIRRFAPLLEK
ncbi:hypothetical protein cyc_04768 [Cyclospora cayetanensis]|uniref:tRNA-intron lyase n=1 Tax=Cyclospora cayetanensis TaxID=88456 RepID=A0A1D3CY03_9EIME|nr:hypothetical protein cyc_04768 [Cyclospora cayetanensis]